MKKGTGFILIGATVVGGFLAGRALRDSDGGDGPVKASDVAIPGGERKKIALSGEFKGPADALVTIVEFSDFQCPFCGRVIPSVDRLLKEYPDKVRLYFKHFPLGFHQDAPLASQAALAAGEQGKFWEMHDKLFANQQAIKRPDLERHAQELGLDMNRFKQALDSGKFKARVDSDSALGASVGVSGTPAFFINGRSLVGAQPYERFKAVVDEEIATAGKLLAKGTPRSKLYETFLASAPAPGAAPAPPPQPSGPARPNISAEVYKVAIGTAATTGAKEPKVTIVEFSEFQCPYCGRAAPSMKQLLGAFKDDVQIAFKHLPLPFHENAMNAALAAEGAREQGKFWEMHDKMFANQQMLARPTLEQYAQELGLDLTKFRAAFDDPKLKARIEADKTQATQFGATGTPTFFVNGRKMVGAQPFEAFKVAVEEEIKKADDKLKAGVPRGQLYAAIIKEGLEKVAPRPAPPGAPDPSTVYRAEAKGPSKGAKDALVTIVQYSDFQCPFCSRVEPTMDKILEEYKGKVRVVWRDFPLDFHKDAMPAAIVGRVAAEQGKFWELHAKLFANQRALDRASLEKYAQEVGLPAGKVKAALDSDKAKYEAQVKADAEAGGKIGVQGTPAFFINGTFLSGAQPFEAFKGRIDSELEKAQALVKKGVARGKLYDHIMKEAKTSVPAAPAAAAKGGEEPSPETDQTVFKVDAGKSFARGPKNAPITVVLFSDFQCPFCSRVEPSIAQLEKDFPGKIRVVWKDYPLPFHPNARPAAIAARVAGEEGKFWQMHGKLFENQRALDRPNLEKFAQELGVNVQKLRSALDSDKYSADIDADLKVGQSLGVSGTPAAFINGRKISGAYPYDTFKKVVEQELAKSRKRS